MFVKDVKGDKQKRLTIAHNGDLRNWECRACHTNLYKEDSRHTRIPSKCRHPGIESVSWDCPACRTGKPRDHIRHTLEIGECRWHMKDHRAAHNRSSKSGPRDPRVPSANEPTQSLKIEAGTQLDRCPNEEDFLDIDPAEVPDGRPGASSTSIDKPQ